MVIPNVVRTGLLSKKSFDDVGILIHYTPDSVAGALLAGLAAGRRDVYLSFSDWAVIQLDRVCPAASAVMAQLGSLFVLDIKDTNDASPVLGRCGA